MEQKQVSKQACNTIRALLELRKGQTFDGITARYHLREAYGLTYDHHEIAFILDEMYQCGLADRTDNSYDGHIEYVIK